MRLYLRFFSMHLRSQMQYKVSFFLTLLGQLMVSLSSLAGVYFMFARFNRVKGFALEEVLLCLAVVLMAFSLAEFIFRGFDAFAGIISQGIFDRFMVRPRNVVFQVVCARMDFTRLGRVLQAVLLFCVAVPGSGIDWTPARLLVLGFMIIGGICAFAGLFIAYAAICFFTIEGLEFMNILTDGAREFGAYPFSIYGDGVLRFFTYIVPLACFQYYPLLYICGHSDNIMYALLPVVSVLFIIPCILLWRVGVRRFASTGS